MFYVKKNYDTVNEFALEAILANNTPFKDPDFVIVTDISLKEEVLNTFLEHNINVIILDHHETAYELNKYDNCYVDEGDELSGAGVTLEFIKKLGYDKPDLDKLNDIANDYDLFEFKNDPSKRKFDLMGYKRSLAEMLNSLFFQTKEKDDFVERWKNGWGNGFTPEEVKILKKEMEESIHNLETIKSNPKVAVPLSDKVILLFNNRFIGFTCEYYLDELGYDVVLIYNIERQKYSGRVNDNANINIGKIFKTMAENCDYVDNGGGHEKAGGGNLRSNEHIQNFAENVVKLCSYYANK